MISSTTTKGLSSEGGKLRRGFITQGMGLIHSQSIKSRDQDSLNNSSRSSYSCNMISGRHKNHLSHTSSAILNQDSSRAQASWHNCQMKSLDSDAQLTMNTSPSSASDKGLSDHPQPFSSDLDDTYDEKKHDVFRLGGGQQMVQTDIHDFLRSNKQQRPLKSDQGRPGNFTSAQIHPHNCEGDYNPPQPTRYRSRSPALPCMPPKTKKHYGHCDNIIYDQDDEYSLAHAELMYSQATWRMYDRIMSARKKATASKLNQVGTPSTEQLNAHIIRRVPHPIQPYQNPRDNSHPDMHKIPGNVQTGHGHLHHQETQSTNNNEMDRSCCSDSNDHDHIPIFFSLEMET